MARYLSWRLPAGIYIHDIRVHQNQFKQVSQSPNCNGTLSLDLVFGSLVGLQLKLHYIF
jgi:hypothetical protein